MKNADEDIPSALCRGREPIRARQESAGTGRAGHGLGIQVSPTSSDLRPVAASFRWFGASVAIGLEQRERVLSRHLC